jgi:hypothetical protein
VKKEDLQEWCSQQDNTKVTPADIAIAETSNFKLKTAEDLQRDFESFKAQTAAKAAAAQAAMQQKSWRNGAANNNAAAAAGEKDSTAAEDSQ